ncbi:uncharacterized protein LOC115620481 isoform X4 [Scaptodrosophila lebanonensis]|uniref:Uncharacterized protein LOC115620481 isoform X4 n=1 Tax=Drosophila lebanonensis TaxID=7225 RepID=A0A6J2SYE2_DROLE|nr:uncharacterized protein LOC115620481 isoform X4 [Scaptodrosophila lebanonensis]
MAASPRQLEAIFIATPPSTPLSLTRTTTPRDLPTMYHFDFVPNTTESDTIEQRDPEAEAANAAPPPPLTKGPPVPEHGQSSFSELTPCPNCSRTFNLNALRKHVPICEKTSKKRNVFDSSRQRREGTTLATYVLPKNFGLPNAEKAAGVHSPTAITRAPEPSHSPTRSNDSPMPVRRKSTGNTELVRATVRASLRKAATTGEPSAPAAPVAPAAPAAPSAAPTPKSSFVRDRMRSSERSVALSKRHKDVACERCPHCERTFNAKAFDRHVEWCKEKAIQATIKLTGTTETNKAKERLEARKQYRPPNLKTKRSINRDKYSNAQDDLLDAGDMVASKDHSLMSLSSLTSSVHSDNQPHNITSKIPRSDAAHGSKKAISQNPVNVQKDLPETSGVRLTRRVVLQKQRETCEQVDAAVRRARSASRTEAMQLATLDCAEAAHLQPVKRRGNKPKTNREKVDAAEKKLNLPPLQAVRFDQLNELIKRKAETAVCNIRMDEKYKNILLSEKIPKSSTSLVRQARRRIRTRENPSIEMANVLTTSEQEMQTSALAPYMADSNGCVESRRESAKTSSRDVNLPLIHAVQSAVYQGFDEEIQIKMEATTSTTAICRNKKRSIMGADVSSAEAMRAINMSIPQSLMPSMDSCKTNQAKQANMKMLEYYENEEDLDSPCDIEYYDDDEVLGRKAKLLERALTSPEEDDDESDGEHIPQLRKHANSDTNISRRLVVLEEDENGVMYIKPPPKLRSRTSLNLKRSDSTVSSSCGSGSYKSTQGSGDEKLRRERSNASSCNSNENRNGKNNSDVGNQKKEIFISIETEPNAQGHSPISPDSLRQMVGNAQTPIEMVEIDNGNEPEHSKFSKISDTDDADGEIDDNMGAGQTRMAPSSIPATESYQQESPHDDLPNVQFNNAKNLIHQMQKEFRQLGEDASASMRKAMMIRSSATGEGYDMAPEQQEQQQQHQQQQAPTKSMLPQQQQQQQYHHQQHQQQTKAQSPLTPSGDSDELSSLDGYPISSSQSSRRGASSKLSSDSAYGSSHSPYSLSRQRSSELSGTPRSQGSNSAGGGAGSQCMRPHTASGVVGNNATNNSNNMAATMMDASTQAHSGYGTLKMRQRLFGGSDLGNVDGHSETSSSGSENCLSVAGQQTNYNQQQPMQQQQQIQQQLHQQQQQMHQQQQQLHQQQQQLLMQPMQQPQAVYGSSSNNNYVLTEMNASSMNNNNGMHMVVTPTTSQHSLLSSASNTSMSSSMKMSKFCHECGAKFILEQAKFCMDCGVRRMIL